MCDYAKKVEKDLKKYINITVQKRLIGEEIIYHNLKNKEIIFFWLDINKE